MKPLRIVSGMPTKPDVDRLRAKFGTPAEGTLLPYSEIEEVIGLGRYTSRGAAVVTAWRKSLMKEHNIALGAEPGNGYVVLTPTERVEAASHGIWVGGRKIKRSVHLSETSDRERMTPEAKKASEHIGRLGAALILAQATATKQIKVPELGKK